MKAQIGIIGGSGFYEIDGVDVVDTIATNTPFGEPSGDIVLTQIDETPVAFLPRHGHGHAIPPHEVPYRANIYALKQIGVERIVALNAVGSLTEEYRPGDMVLPDDLFDRTAGRASTFFARGLVAHTGFAEPFCRTVRADLLSAEPLVDAQLHRGGTLVVVNGPRFSTRAESEYHRRAGFKLIGMTAMPEAVLAREAEICYASLCIVTDYDVWRETEEDVSADIVLTGLRRAMGHARKLVTAAVPALRNRGPCQCHDSMAAARVTSPGATDPAMAEVLRPIIGRYL